MWSLERSDISTTDSSLSYSLFFEGEPVAVGTVRSSDISKSYSTELLSFEASDSRDSFKEWLKLYLKLSSVDSFLVPISFHDLAQYCGEAFDLTEDGHQWIDSERTYYLYSIRATDSNKYYYGVSHLKQAAATQEDCLNHSYMGSGGLKFKNWRDRHSDSLFKEIISLYSSKHDAYLAERELIGESFASDPLCLNSTAGGKHGGGFREEWLAQSKKIKTCSKHGEVFHQGNFCSVCLALDSTTLKECTVHGLVKHRGERCYRCSIKKQFSNQICSLHGEALHRGTHCLRCTSGSRFLKKECELHGEVKFLGDRCTACEASARKSIKNCSIHGEVLFSGSSCISCSNISAVSQRLCPTHGLVAHQGDTCTVCSSLKSVSLKECSIHGSSKHRGNFCSLCVVGKTSSKRECSIHGVVTHQGDTCSSCTSSKAYSLGECSIHGEVKHQKGVCLKCRFAKSISLKHCDLHGLVKHNKNSCSTCAAEKRWRARSHS